MSPAGGDVVPADLSEDPEVVRAVSSFFRHDADRILAIASRLGEGGRSVESTVRGGSMGEALPEGTRIRIQLARPTGYRRGDIVAFLAGTTVVVHRVVHCGRGSRRGYLLTRGDDKIVPDPPVEVTSVLGLVTGQWRDGGWASIPGPASRMGRRGAEARLASVLTTAITYVSPRLAHALILGHYHRMLRRRAPAGDHFRSA